MASLLPTSESPTAVLVGRKTCTISSLPAITAAPEPYPLQHASKQSPAFPELQSSPAKHSTSRSLPSHSHFLLQMNSPFVGNAV